MRRVWRRWQPLLYPAIPIVVGIYTSILRFLDWYGRGDALVGLGDTLPSWLKVVEHPLFSIFMLAGGFIWLAFLARESPAKMPVILGPDHKPVVGSKHPVLAIALSSFCFASFVGILSWLYFRNQSPYIQPQYIQPQSVPQIQTKTVEQKTKDAPNSDSLRSEKSEKERDRRRNIRGKIASFMDQTYGLIWDATHSNPYDQNYAYSWESDVIRYLRSIDPSYAERFKSAPPIVTNLPMTGEEWANRIKMEQEILGQFLQEFRD